MLEEENIHKRMLREVKKAYSEVLHTAFEAE